MPAIIDTLDRSAAALTRGCVDTVRRPPNGWFPVHAALPGLN